MGSSDNVVKNDEFISRFMQFEKRVSELETLLKSKTIADYEDEVPELENPIKSIHLGNVFESKVGEIGLAWIGNIVLLFGIIFLVQFIRDVSNPLISFAFAYAAVIGVFSISRYIKESYSYMSSIFNFNGHLLLAFFTLRLHYFNSEVLVSNDILGLIIFLVVIGLQVFIAIKNKSRSVSFVALLFLSIGAIATNEVHIMLPLGVIIAVLSIYLTLRTSWTKLLFFGIFLAYFVNVIWFLNNPFLNETLEIIKLHNYGYFYFFLIALIYSSIAIFKETELFTKPIVISAVVLNGFAFSVLLFALINSFFPSNYVLLLGTVSIFCLLYAVVLQLKTEYRTTSALYALYGFVTLSIAFFGIYGYPRTYFLLAIQSLLVVSFAIWSRSKFIVFMNSIMFVLLLIFYHSTSIQLNGVNISFTLAALISARILNWKKERLTIKTDFLRNLYLVTAFVMMLITIYHIVPASFITVSWASIGIVYFLISWLLHNVKYRYMALGTIMVAVVYLFIVDLATIELVFRVLALMLIAAFSIGISIYYSKIKGKTKEVN